MTESEKDPEVIVHEHSITVDGKTVEVHIIEDADGGGWILEVVDEYWNSTVWDDLFPSERDALNEVHDAIKTEGIESLIGSPPKPKQS